MKKLYSLIAFLLLSQVVRADFVFSFNSLGVDQTFTVAEASTVSVPIYLVQTNGENRLSTIGLFASGVSLDFDHGSGAVGNASLSQAALAAHWTDLNLNRVEQIANSIVLEGLVENPSLPVFATSNAVLLGNVEFQAGSLGNITDLQLSLTNVNAFANLLIDTNEVSPLQFRSGSIATITSVPEPSSFLLVVLSFASGVFLRRNARP